LTKGTYPFIKDPFKRGYMHLSILLKRVVIAGLLAIISFPMQVLQSYETPQKVARGYPFLAMSWANAPLAGVGIPPFPHGAMGPKQFLLTSINGFRTLTRKGKPDGVINSTSLSFFNLSPGLNADYPRGFYDFFINRWVVGFVPFALGNPFYLALSKNSVIKETSEWMPYFLEGDLIPDPNGQGGDTGRQGFDSGMGFDKFAYYLGKHVDFFNVSNQKTLYVMQKQSLVKGGTPVATAFRNLRNEGEDITLPNPVINFEQDSKFGYVTSYQRTLNLGPATEWSQLALFRVVDPGSTTPTISRINVPLPEKINNPLQAPLKEGLYGVNTAIGVSGNLDRVNPLSNGIVRNGHLYLLAVLRVDANGVSSPTGDRDAVRFYEWNLKGNDPVETATSVPTLVQTFTIFNPGPLTDDTRFYFTPSLAVNKRGDILIGGSTSAVNLFPNAWFAGRLATDPLNTIGNPVLFTNSQFPYNVAGANERWGNYSATVVDPCNDLDFVTLQEAIADFDVWGLYVALIKSP
jgi:hypothetical protein